MMKCNKCGTEVNPQDEFCYNCGAQITRKKEKQKDKPKNKPEVQEYQLKEKEIEKLSQSFASRDEKYIASLGNGYIMNYLANRSMNKGFAFITDKRVYFKGSCLSGAGKKLVKTNEERTVDVKNITGSGFIYQRYWGILIALFISLLASLAGAVWGVWLSYLQDVSTTVVPDAMAGAGSGSSIAPLYTLPIDISLVIPRIVNATQAFSQKDFAFFGACSCIGIC